MEKTMDTDPGTRTLRLLFSSEDLTYARRAYTLLNGDEPGRALRWDPVLRWTEATWTANARILKDSGFDRRRPGHITALQWLIDQACDLGTAK
jgi:hypothetical protein